MVSVQCMQNAECVHVSFLYLLCNCDFERSLEELRLFTSQNAFSVEESTEEVLVAADDCTDVDCGVDAVSSAD